MATFKGRWDFLLAAILFLLAMAAQRADLFAALELQTQSFRQILRMADAERVFPEDKIVFVNQDEAFFEDYGSWPLRRLDLARVAENVEALGGRVMAVDNLFDFPSSYGEDGPTAEKFEGVPGLLLVSQGVVEDGRLIYIKQPVEPINGVARTGYTNVESRSGLSEVISDLRLFPEAIPMENGWPFAVQAVGLYLGETPSYDRETRVLSFGDQLSVQLDQNHRLAIDFPSFPAGAQGYVADFGIPVLEMLRLDELEEDEAWELRFWVEDKIVILGDTSEVSHDYFETPVGRLYGVELIGATIATLLAGGALLPASFGMEAAVALGLLLALVGTGLLQNPAGRLAASLAALGLWAVLATVLYVDQGVMLSMAYAGVAAILSIVLMNIRFYLVERGQKTLIRDAFGQYLSPKVVNILVKDPSRLSLGGEQREMTAFFSDVAGFSSISEQLTPAGLVALLNEYLTAMCDIIAEHEGTVDKFEGDAIIAFWGAPLDQPDHALKACLAAIDMQRYMVDYRKRLEAEGRPLLKVRMGLNSGQILVGNMGSAQRMDYTIMGDAVNLAARLEGVNKFYGSATLISQHTQRLVGDALEVREVDVVRVVGKNEPVTLFEPLARAGELRPEESALREAFAEARGHYQRRDFPAAVAAFEAVLAKFPGDGPSETLLARSKLYAEAPPPADWDGVFQLTEKG